MAIRRRGTRRASAKSARTKRPASRRKQRPKATPSRKSRASQTPRLPVKAFLEEARLADLALGLRRLTRAAARPDVTRVAPKKAKKKAKPEEGAAGPFAAGPFAAAPLVAPGFDPRDPLTQERLSGPVKTQPPKDRHCAAFALTTAMETWLCRNRNTNTGLEPLSTKHAVIQSGNQEMLGPTALGLAQGIREDVCFESGTGCVDPQRKTWRGIVSRVTVPGTDRPAVLRQLLESGKVLAISIPLFENFAAFKGTGTYTASGKKIGAHALCIVGFEQPPGEPGVWIVKNSFGSNWGDQGYARFQWNDPKVEPERAVFMVERVERVG